jgi:hypothetical protein
MRKVPSVRLLSPQSDAKVWTNSNNSCLDTRSACTSLFKPSRSISNFPRFPQTLHHPRPMRLPRRPQFRPIRAHVSHFEQKRDLASQEPKACRRSRRCFSLIALVGSWNFAAFQSICLKRPGSLKFWNAIIQIAMVARAGRSVACGKLHSCARLPG